jgi:hypothetical protein
LGRDPDLLADVLRNHLRNLELQAVETARQGSAMELRYDGQLSAEGSLSAIVVQLNQLEGVQQVEVRRR